MYGQKAVAVALLLVLTFNLLAVLGGKFSEESMYEEDTGFDPPERPIIDFPIRSGTRASDNIDFVGKPLFGHSYDIQVVGNYAYIAAGYSFLIFDVADPLDPQLTGYWDSTSPVNGVYVEGNFAYVANSVSGIAVVDIGTPDNPTKVGENDTSGTVYEVVVSGDYAYAACEGEGLIIYDVSTPSNPTYVGKNDTCALSEGVFVSEPYAYLADFFYGLVIIDVTDKSRPDLVAQEPGNGFAQAITLNGNYVYMGEFWGGITVMDVSQPDAPTETGFYPTDDSVLSLSVAAGHLYTAASSYGLEIYELGGDPPTLTAQGNWKTGDWTQDIQVDGNYAYIADDSAGFKIMDVSDPADPLHVGFYDTDGYAEEVEVVGDMAYIADGYGGFVALDISDPTNPVLSWDYSLTFANAYGVDVVGSYAYIAAYDDGLRIVDINTHDEVGFVDPSWGYMYSVEVHDDIAYIGDSEGLRIISVSDPTSPWEMGFYGFPTSGYVDVDKVGSYAYLADADSGLTIIDITNSSNPVFANSYEQGLSRGVFALGTTVYLADNDQLIALDTSDMSSITQIGFFEQGGAPLNVEVVYPYAYVSASFGGAYVLDISQVADSTPPQVSSNFPLADETNVPPGTDIRISFNENMIHSTVENAFSIIPSVPGQLSWNGTTLIFTPDSELDIMTTYTVSLSAASMDTAGYTLDGNRNGAEDGSPADDHSWEFTTSEIPPVVVSVSPEDGMSSVPVQSSILINFSKSMDKSLTASALSYTDGVSTFPVSTGQVAWSNSDMTMTFTPFALFANDAAYEFTMASSAADTGGRNLDSNGNGIGGEDPEDDYTWSFVTAPVSPRVISVMPEDETVYVPVDTGITINFSKSMERTSTQNAFTFTDGITIWGSDDGSVTWSQSDMTFTFTPSNDLERGIQYNVTLLHTAADTDGLRLDADGDGIGGEFSDDNLTWSFTTIPIPPVVNSTFPGDGTSLVPVNTDVVMNFSRSMDRTKTLAALKYTDGSSNFNPTASQVKWSNDSMSLRFIPSTFFLNHKTYTFTLASTAEDAHGALLDGDGDGIGGEETEDDFSFSFTTMHLPAKVQQTTPVKKDTMVAVDTKIIVKFTRDMDNDSVEAAFSYTHENTTTVWGVSDGEVEWTDGRTFEFTPDKLLDHDRVYTVTILSTAEDALGVTLDGDKDKIPSGTSADDHSWEFTTIREPPVVESVEPGNNSEDVQLTAKLEIRFDRGMKTKATEDAFSFTHNGTSETWDNTDGTGIWTEGNSVFSFQADFDLDEGSVYTVSVDGTAEDEDGVPFPGFSWQFTTKVNAPPILENGAARREDGALYVFSIIYTDSDDDEPTEKILVVNEVEWKMTDSESSDSTFTDGKNYIFQLDLDEGEYEYYFEFSDGKNRVSFPGKGQTKKLQVEARDEDEEKVLGIFNEEYAGIPTMPCMPIGLIIIVILVVVLVARSSKRKKARRQAEAATTFQSFEPAPATFQSFEPTAEFQTFDEAPPLTFDLMSEEPIMSFSAFEETAPSMEGVKPAIVQCPDCGEYLRVRATHKPFEFPCKCGARLVLK